MPDTIRGVFDVNTVVYSSDIAMDNRVVEILRKI